MTIMPAESGAWGHGRPASPIAAPADALARWREQLWSTYVRLESRSEAERFYGYIDLMVPGSAQLSQVSSTAQITERTPALVRSDPRDDLLVAFQRRGQGHAEQHGRQAATLPGDFVLYETRQPYRLAFGGPFTQHVFRLPRALLAARLPDLSSLTARRISGADGLGALVSRFFADIAGRSDRLGPEDLEALQTSCTEMIHAALQSLCPQPAEKGAAEFQRFIRSLGADIADPDFNFPEVARRRGMSLRTLQRLFRERGLTPRGWLLERRLAGAAGDLQGPGSARGTVTEIALNWGFNDLAYFHRSFRRAYGTSPGVWRARRT